jgi:hypothetical protein
MKKFILLAVVFAILSTLPGFTQVPATIILKDGDVIDSSTVNNISNPFTNEAGQVGFTFSLVNGDHGVWFDSSALHLNSDVIGTALSGAEFTCGIGRNGKFIFSPTIDSDLDAAWGHAGLILKEGDSIISLPPNISIFNSRPQMYGSANAYWIGGVNASGGTSTEQRFFYRKIDSAAYEVLYPEFDTLLDGTILDDMGFDYDVSDNDSFRILEVAVATGSSADDGGFAINRDSMLAQEGNPTGDGDNWDNFDFISVNNQGHHVWSGDTDGDSGTDEYIALDGQIVLREGDIIDGVTLTSSMSVRGISINDFGKIVFVVSYNGIESLFETDINDFVGNSQLIASIGDMIDTDGDMSGDYIIDDFNTGLGMGLDLSEHNYVFVELDITSIGGGSSLEAIVQFNLDCVDLITLVNGYDDVTNNTPVYAEASNIIANNVIRSNANVGYDAVLGIDLLPGFEVQIGALFEARIDGCGGLSGPVNE